MFLQNQHGQCGNEPARHLQGQIHRHQLGGHCSNPGDTGWVLDKSSGNREAQEACQILDIFLRLSQQYPPIDYMWA